MNKLTHLTLIAAATLAACGCGNADNTGTDADSTRTEQNTAGTASTEQPQQGIEWDYEFPMEYDFGNVEKGQYVLAVDGWKKWAEKGGERATSTHISDLYGRKFEEKGKDMSTLEHGQVSPNALIIPFPKGATAKVGDVVLTFWQHGGGDLRRALVTDASNPRQPKVWYLDLNYKEDGTGLANKHANEQLEENSFMVIPDGQIAPGATVTYKNGSNDECLIFLRDFDGKALCLKQNRSGVVYPTDELKAISFHEKLKPGDEVARLFVNNYRDGYTVVKVDKTSGRIWVADKRGNETIHALGEVTKALK